MRYSAFDFRFFEEIWLATLTAREISSYDELVHEPRRPTETFNGHSFLIASSFSFEIGVARSGLNGPFTCGSSSERLISMIWSKYFSGFAYTSGSAVRCSRILF